MDYSVDWYLIYRNHRGMASLAPQNVSPEDITLRSDPTGVNIFMEIRKPQSGL
jgi:extracellular factor (EF) 3-hydroxypalmitic acid methyl ester biosynthesis protein